MSAPFEPDDITRNAYRGALVSTALNWLGSPLEILIAAEVPHVPRWPFLCSSVLGFVLPPPWRGILPRGLDVVSQAFNSNVGADNDPIQFNGGYVWYDVLDVIPSRERSVDEVKDQLETKWRDDQIMSRLIDWVAFTPLQNVTGEPAISLPLAESATGLPVGMMFGAALGQDARLLELAFELEAAQPFRTRCS